MNGGGSGMEDLEESSLIPVAPSSNWKSEVWVEILSFTTGETTIGVMVNFSLRLITFCFLESGELSDELVLFLWRFPRRLVWVLGGVFFLFLLRAIVVNEC